MLEYVLTEADLAAFAAWQAHESGEDVERRRRLTVIAAWLVGGVAYLVVAAALTIPLLAGRALLLAGGAELIALACGVALGLAEWRSGKLAARLLFRPYRRRARQALARTGGERRLWLDAGGLNVSVGDRSEHVDWTGITRVVETDGHVFVLVGTNAAHVMPKRAGQERVAEIVAELRRRTPGPA